MVIPKISRDKLADMVGTMRSRFSFFMKKFLNPGFIGNNRELHVHSSFLNIVLLPRYSYYWWSWHGSRAKLLPNQSFSP